MQQEQIYRAMALFQAPLEFYQEFILMLTEAEIRLILDIGNQGPLYETELCQRIVENGLSRDPLQFIRQCYNRSVLCKDRDAENRLTYRLDTFYNRLGDYAIYENEDWGRIPKERRQALDHWKHRAYMEDYQESVEKIMQGEDVPMHNRAFLTLEETMALFDRQPEPVIVNPCHCKSMIRDQNRPRHVCLSWADNQDNTPYDRGHGEAISREEAKRRIRQWNAQGLMQCGDEYGFCNCDGRCCYPLRMAKRLGSRGLYPAPNCRIQFHAQKCDGCAQEAEGPRCVKLCNFGAFLQKDGKIVYRPEQCWRCGVCAANCPQNAISALPLQP
ncbi:MAG: 4Fe-4S binding protein [Firmicutes bacterium]|nr:4Fe-4S binding protein [Bacillota bacterium]